MHIKLHRRKDGSGNVSGVRCEQDFLNWARRIDWANGRTGWVQTIPSIPRPDGKALGGESGLYSAVR